MKAISILAWTGPFFAVLVAAFALALAGGSALANNTPSAAIDLDPAGNQSNGPLGSVQRCISQPVGSLMTVDVTVSDIAEADSMIGFQYLLTYDPEMVRITGFDNQQMLSSVAGSDVYDFSDPVPDDDGAVYVVAADLAAQNTREFGDGVLTRITLEVTTPGLGLLSLSDFGIVDRENNSIPVDTAGDAIIAAGRDCPSPGEVTPTPRPTPTTPPAPDPSDGPTPTPWHPDPTPWHPPYQVWIDSASVWPGEVVTVGVYIEAPYPGVGALTIDVLFDPFYLDAVSCAATFPDYYEPICNSNYGPGAVRFTGANAEGAYGLIQVGTVTFAASDEIGDFPVHLSIETLVTPDVNDIGPAEVTDGIVSITPTTPTPSPAPRVPTPPTPHLPTPTPPVRTLHPRPAMLGNGTAAVFEGKVCASSRCNEDLAGKEIIAKIAGLECGSSVIGADSAYRIEVASDADVPGCGVQGKMVEFLVDGRLARPAAIWKAGSQEVDLLVTNGIGLDGTASSTAGKQSTRESKGAASGEENAGSEMIAPVRGSSPSSNLGRLVILLSSVPTLIGAVLFYRGLKRS